MTIKEKPFYQIKGKKVLLESVIDIKNDIYQKNGITIITLVGLQKIADKETIVEKDFRVEITPTGDNKQQHAINIWLGLLGENDKDKWVRGSGEASMLNTGKLIETAQGKHYEEYNQIDSSYRFAMAEKRAFSRALLKMIKLYGVHGEVEAQDFAQEKANKSDLDL